VCLPTEPEKSTRTYLTYLLTPYAGRGTPLDWGGGRRRMYRPLTYIRFPGSKKGQKNRKE
jgi:hypothetical protein